MKRKLFLVVGIMLALGITSVSYAATSASTNVTVQTSDFATVSQADGTDVVGSYGQQPVLSAEGSSGTIDSGDLYVVTPQGTGTGDIYGTLYLSNAAALTDSFSYLNFNVQVYGFPEGGTDWEVVGDPLLLSLTNGYVNFTLTGDYSKYSVGVESGGFYLLNTSTVTDPEFFVEIK